MTEHFVRNETLVQSVTGEGDNIVHSYLVPGTLQLENLLEIHDQVSAYLIFGHELDASQAYLYLDYLAALPEESLTDAFTALAEMTRSVEMYNEQFDQSIGQTSLITGEKISEVDRAYNLWANVTGNIRLLLNEKFITIEQAHNMAAAYNYLTFSNLSDRDLGLLDQQE